MQRKETYATTGSRMIVRFFGGWDFDKNDAYARWTNTIGTSELATVWKDPGFDVKQSAFYYARVIEIPTPRWTAYEAEYYSIKMPKEIPMITAERAYTSPIWYTPKGRIF